MNYIPHSFSRDRKSLATVVLLCILATFLAIRGYPLPYCDDLATIGASISLAKGGEFTNPYVREWMDAFPTEKPYFYPPGLSYLQGSWLSVFGINAVSLLAFQWIAILTLTISSFYFLRVVCNQPKVIGLIAAVSFLLAFQLEGFRGEVVAYAIAMTGTCLVFTHRWPIRLSGYFLLAFSGVVYPIAPFIFAPLFVAGYLTLHHETSIFSPQTWRSFARDLPLAFFGGLAAFAIFLWMIKGEFYEFFRVMSIHKNAAIPGNPWSQLKGYWFICTAYNQVYIRLPLLIFSSVAVCWSLIQSITKKDRTWVIPAFFALACVASIVTNPMRAKTLVPELQIIILLVACNHSTRITSRLGLTFGVLFLFLINLKTLLGAVLQKPIPSQDLLEIRKAASEIDYANSRVMIDAWAARYAYSYNIPASVIDITTWSIVPKLNRNLPSRQIRPSKIATNEVWLAANEIYFLIPEDDREKITKPRAAVALGRRVPSILESQAKFTILRNPMPTPASSDGTASGSEISR